MLSAICQSRISDDNIRGTEEEENRVEVWLTSAKPHSAS